MRLGELSVMDIYEAAIKGARIEASGLEGIDEGAERLVKAAATSRIYGVNTLLGELANSGEGGEADPLDMIRMHACGVGEPAPREWVRASLLVRANQLAQGYSGVRSGLLITMINMLNSGISPVVPVLGSVGSSGDLIPLAHIALAVAGEGEAEASGERLPAAEALRRIGLTPFTPNLREALAMINGTSFSAGALAVELVNSFLVAIGSIASTVMIMEAARGSLSPNSIEVNAVKRHKAPLLVAGLLEESLAGSRRVNSSGRVQDPYSIRCSSLVIGAAIDALWWARRNLENEVNSTSDNPVMIGTNFKSTCHFHGQYISISSDLARNAVASLINLEERRSAQLLRREINGSEEYLGRRGGVGFMIMQYTNAGLSGLARQLSTPALVNNVPTSGFQEDVVAMSLNSVYLLRQLNELAFRSIAINLLLSYVALDRDGCGGCGGTGRLLHELIGDRWRDGDVSASIEAVARDLPFILGKFLESRGLTLRGVVEGDRLTNR
ncbi:histidine ammonia-lyase [Thermocladium modestius]|uniref:Histidine ammonia-lyase n=1 Tax=Thermocladium modestius TaxID=62609 RepID=A0A830GTM8_9CREN|nr:aromatic amino acid ammonia-lyase [Thermocladium modestius]GGP19981.1 histidine ammonia-lyase [Thermocladium modestius]